jgi:hypothetical protein
VSQNDTARRGPAGVPERRERDALGTSGMALAPQVVFVVVSGPPAGGKSTLAPALAGEQALPLIVKDAIRDVLMSVRPVPDVAASRNRGPGAVAAMLAVAADSPIGAVIESNFSPVARSQGPSSPPWPRRRDLLTLRSDSHAGSVRRQGRQSTRWTLSPGAGQFLRSTRTRPSTVPSPWPSSEARWLNRHLTSTGKN